ncbi:hypothetical protein [Streptomyces thermolineatus]|uniref:hypothetical protein n=1 Tax=Streptomyces thermolineatus TaxID=44033 RepID=UPI00384EAD20
MGYTVLYIAFGVVALWLLGEVLLQYKARLRWRVLAFAGFMGVVTGVAAHSVVVICLGAVAFGTGQTFVTLSYRKGFSSGWALGGRPGTSRRRRTEAARTEPTLEVSGIEEAPAAPAHGTGHDAHEAYDTGHDAHDAGRGAERWASPVDGDPYGGDGPGTAYVPQPMDDDTGGYAAYRPAAAEPQYPGGPYAGTPAYPASYDEPQHGRPQEPDSYGFPGPGEAPDAGAPQTGGQEYGQSYGQEYGQDYTQDYGRQYEQQQYEQQQYGQYYDYGQYPAAQQPQQPQQFEDPYYDTPAGGVWVPQQREGEPGAAPVPEPGPHPGGYDQYRY